VTSKAFCSCSERCLESATELVDLIENQSAGIHRSRVWVDVTDFDEMGPKHPKLIAVAEQDFAGIPVGQRVLQERPEDFHERLSERDVLLLEAP
jgi:hypothetical protein